MPFSLNLGGFSLPLEDSAGGTSSGAWNYQGNYDNGISYNTDDIVFYNGGLWYCYTSANLSAGYPPDSRPECWVQVSNTNGGGNPFDQSLNTTDNVTFGTASFGNGGFTIDSSGNITSSINLVGDYINFGTSFLQNNGNIRCQGNISVGNELWLNGDGSASFANGATFIDQYGNLCVGNTGSSYQNFINADGSASFNGGMVQISTYGDFSAKTVNAMGSAGSGPYGWTPMVYMDPFGNGSGGLGAMYFGSTDWYIYGAANSYDGKSISLDSGNITSDGAGNLHVNSITTATGGTGGFDPSSNPNFSGGLTIGQNTDENNNPIPIVTFSNNGSVTFGADYGYNSKLYIHTELGGTNMYFGYRGNYSDYTSVLRADGSAQFGYFNHGGNTFDQYGYLTVPAISVGGQGSDLPIDAAGITYEGHIYCSNPVSSSTDSTVDSKVEIMINGTAYYLLASTSAS